MIDRRLVLVVILMLAELLARSEGTRQKRSDDSNPLEAVVENLSQQVNTLTAKVTELEARAAKDELAIAFHARSTDHTFDVLPNGPVILPYVVTAVGTGYDAATGNFQAPVSGTYLFIATATVQAPGVAWVNIMVDGQWMAQLVTNSGDELDQGSVSFPVHLNKGQRVNLANGSNTQRTLRGEIYTTFTGLLLKSD